jgi:hypothetical protein
LVPEPVKAAKTFFIPEEMLNTRINRQINEFKKEFNIFKQSILPKPSRSE